MNYIVQWAGWATLTISGLFVLLCACAYAISLGEKLIRKGIAFADLREAILDWKRHNPEKAKRYE